MEVCIRTSLKTGNLAILNTRNKMIGDVFNGVTGKDSIDFILSPSVGAAGLAAVGTPPAVSSGVLLAPFSASKASRKLPGRGFSFFIIQTNFSLMNVFASVLSLPS